MRKISHLILLPILLLTACTPTPEPAPTAVLATATKAMTSTVTVKPTQKNTPSITPSITSTQEDFSDLRPELTVEAALNSDYLLAREDLERAVRKAKVEAEPFRDDVEPAQYYILETQTGMVNMEYYDEQVYHDDLESIPMKIEGIYRLNDYWGEYGLLLIARYKTSDGDGYVTYHFDPTQGDPRLKLVDQHVIILPIYFSLYDEENAAYVKDLSEESLPIDGLVDIHRDVVKEYLSEWVNTGKVSENLWKTPLRPSTDFKKLRN